MLVPLSYNLAGGEWDPDPVTPVADNYLWGSEHIITGDNPKRAGYTFDGWAVSGAGAVLSGGTLTMGTAATTLTAKWKGGPIGPGGGTEPPTEPPTDPPGDDPPPAVMVDPEKDPNGDPLKTKPDGDPLTNPVDITGGLPELEDPEGWKFLGWYRKDKDGKPGA